MDGSRRSSIVTEGKKSPGIHRSLSDPESDDIERGAGGAGPEEDEDEDEQFDLMRILQQTSPKGVDDRFVAHETVEYVPESMSSYLNRKTALLMLWFPLGVSVSCDGLQVCLVDHLLSTCCCSRFPSLESYTTLRARLRLSCEQYRGGSSFPKGSPTRSSTVSSSGSELGSLLVVSKARKVSLIGLSTKRVVRKRVRKGTFSPANSSRGGGGSNIGSALRGWRGGHSKPTG